ncbi:hypothetical protein OHS71_17990 [Streptomyces sp. NBC_00377]|uniref:hypothetical protein n=1 Tax=unclassified Streptomyces TaxID=2593676 RepID=UPI002E1B29F7|nr:MULTISPECIES: hypothetical protein [unclassified Streptomyces]
MSDHQIIVHRGALFERTVVAVEQVVRGMTDATRAVNVMHDTIDGRVLANT